MRFRKNLLVIFASLLIASAVFGAEKYQIDLAHSSVGFTVKHLMISNVKGGFKDFSGTIIFDDKDISKSSVTVTIKVASINTHDDNRDGHLRSPDFFDAEKYSDITFTSKRIEKQGDGWVLMGDLTIKNVTKEVTFPFTLVGPINDPWGNKRIAAQGSLNIDRQDYGVSWNKTLDNGGLLVGNDVRIDFEIEATTPIFY
jgi:polyisoprenoid-binding protein YceI